MPDSQFFEDLSRLCAREMAFAERVGDADRKSEVISALAIMLGRTVSRAAAGNGDLVEALLIGAEHTASEAASDYDLLREVQGTPTMAISTRTGE